MAHVLTVKLPNSKMLSINADELHEKIHNLFMAGMHEGQVRATKGNAAEQQVRLAAARERTDVAYIEAEAAVQSLYQEWTPQVWEAAMTEQFPYRCTGCGERFTEMRDLLDHVLDEDGENPTASECYGAMQQTLRLASETGTVE